MKLLQDSIAEAMKAEAAAEEQLSSVRFDVEAKGRQRALLEEQCLQGRARLAETNVRLRHFQLSGPTEREELKRLELQLENLAARVAAASAELAGSRERGAREEAQIQSLRSEVVTEDEARNLAGKAAFSRREELDEALNALSLLKEQYAEVQVLTQRILEDTEWRLDEKKSLWTELQRRESWLATVSRELSSLPDVRHRLDEVVADTEAARTRIGVEEAESRRCENELRIKQAQLAELEHQVRDLEQRLRKAEELRDSLRSELAEADSEQARQEADIEQLRHDKANSAGMCQNLEGEVRLLLSQCEGLRKDHSNLVIERSEMQQRLQLVTPGLQEARKQLQELEAKLEATAAACAHEKLVGEKLERETLVCQDRMQAMRDANVGLAERCVELEAQVEQRPGFTTPRSGSGTPSRAARMAPGAGAVRGRGASRRGAEN